MNLIFCPECCDVRALRTIEVRISCACGKSHGIVANIDTQEALNAFVEAIR